jgi:hypothetical protein
MNNCHEWQTNNSTEESEKREWEGMQIDRSAKVQDKKNSGENERGGLGYKSKQ